MVEILTPVALVLTGYAVALFIISIFLKRNDIADVAWGPGIVLVAIVGLSASTVSPMWPHYLMVALMSVWALRLSLRIYLKNRSKPEDARYKAWRDSWGVWFYPRSFLQVYALQCFLMILLAASALSAALTEPQAFLMPAISIGALVWLLGFYFEVVGDYQLDSFLKKPENKGKLMQSGLWHYTRHPNYFGEVTMWWGLWLMLAGTPYVWLGLISPLTITILIVFVSGIPMLEPLMEKHPDWAEYKRRTSVLVPWWPKA